MRTSIRVIAISAAVGLAAGGMTACGGGGGGGGYVAQVGPVTITKAELSHWMTTLAGGDFYELSKKHTVPADLVAEPANYSACVASLETAAENAAAIPAKAHAAPRPTSSQLLTKCHEVYQALRFQAMAYLVNAQWSIGVYREVGVTASEAEVDSALEEFKKREYPIPGSFDVFLKRTRRSLGDELFMVKLNVLNDKLSQQAHSLGIERVRNKFSEAGLRWTNKTNCRAGYVVPHCRQFKEGSTPTPKGPTEDAAILMEQLATVTGVPCNNRAACG
jgi:hypothetical protein